MRAATRTARTPRHGQTQSLAPHCIPPPHVDAFATLAHRVIPTLLPDRRSEIELSAVDAVYEQMEADAMMELLGEMQSEIMSELAFDSPAAAAEPSSDSTDADADSSSRKRDRSGDLLWDVVATPSMMQAFSAAVRAAGPSAVAVGS